jgi:Histidine phosphatase superfamily (branch 2)
MTIVDGESNGPLQSLSTAGEYQMEQLGSWLRMEYENNVKLLDDNVSGPTGETSGFVDQYYPLRFRMESSEYDTTILSAQALARGLFPSKVNQVPVFTQSARNDITISSGDQCPSLLHDINLLSTKQNMDFNEMEAAYMNLLTALASLPILSAYAKEGTQGTYIPLYNVWKVYDIVREAKMTCTEGYESMDLEACSKLPFPTAAQLLTETEWNDLKTLVRYAEVQTKYGTDKAAALLASNLLQQMEERIFDDQVSQPHDETTKRVFVSSADYPVIVALLALLKIEPDDNVEDEVIPAYGSAFIIELYQDDLSLEHTVRIKYKAAGKIRPSALRMGDHCHDTAGCTMEGFSMHLDNKVLRTKDWCRSCGNDFSDICLFYSRSEYEAKLRDVQARFGMMTLLNNMTNVEASVNSTNGTPNDGYTRDGFAGVFVGGMALGIILAGFFFVVVSCLRKAKDSGSATTTAKREASFRDEAMSQTSSLDMDADERSIPNEDDYLCSHGTPASLMSEVSLCPSTKTTQVLSPPEIV